MVGTDAAPLHAPRGMFTVGDTVWAADVDGVHGFHRGTGAHLAFIDMTGFEPGFLNDVAAGPDGRVLASADDREGILYAEIDLRETDRARARRPYLDLRRPEAYDLG